MPQMTEIKRAARQAGLLYLAMSILAMLSYFYVGRLFFVPGDAAATARNILERETLYRGSILLDLAVELLFILVVLALYRPFRDVDRPVARVMVAFAGMGIIAQLAGFALYLAPLVLLKGGASYSTFSQAQLETLSYAAMSLNGKQGQLLTAIWGLWLFPFAILTIRSGFLPKFLGVLLVLTGVAYVVTSFVGIALPELAGPVRKFAFPLYFGEFIVVLWLAFVGARPGEPGTLTVPAVAPPTPAST